MALKFPPSFRFLFSRGRPVVFVLLSACGSTRQQEGAEAAGTAKTESTHHTNTDAIRLLLPHRIPLYFFRLLNPGRTKKSLQLPPSSAMVRLSKGTKERLWRVRV